ncbi:MAG: twin-arginine translocase subunit TatB [Gammaproteobacteria bacterium]|nr:MAG: twin-arginine translocase subunit TatB [Gammaproteobacteria bacterium]
MFDIGFFELVILAVIGLLVLGPERLPHAVRMTAAWIGRFRRAALTVREEIEREVNTMEMQQRLKQQMENSGLQEAKDALEETGQALRNGILNEQTLKDIEQQGLQNYTSHLMESEQPAAQPAAQPAETSDAVQEAPAAATHSTDKPA